MSAETAYLFRHALLREAAYQLQLPGDRSRLHALALSVLEELAGGRPPEPPPLGPDVDVLIPPHASDAFARELAGQAGSAGGPDMAGLRRLYLRRAAEHASRSYRNEEAWTLWQEYATLVPRLEHSVALRRAAGVTPVRPAR